MGGQLEGRTDSVTLEGKQTGKTALETDKTINQISRAPLDICGAALEVNLMSGHMGRVILEVDQTVKVQDWRPAAGM